MTSYSSDCGTLGYRTLAKAAQLRLEADILELRAEVETLKEEIKRLKAASAGQRTYGGFSHQIRESFPVCMRCHSPQHHVSDCPY